MSKFLFEDSNGVIIESDVYETKLLTEAEVKERVKKTPKINVNALLQKGYVAADKFHHDLENGLLQ